VLVEGQDDVDVGEDCGRGHGRGGLVWLKRKQNKDTLELASSRINEDLKSIKHWFSNNGFICNTRKTVKMVIASHRAVKSATDVRISYGDSLLGQKRSFKYLTVIVDESLSWNSHIPYVYPKLKLLNRISSFLDPTTLLKTCKVTILPILDYGCILWGSSSKKNSDLLERLQNKAMRTILRANDMTCLQTRRDKLGLLMLASRQNLCIFS